MVDVIVQKALEYIAFDLPYSHVSLLIHEETLGLMFIEINKAFDCVDHNLSPKFYIQVILGLV